jgi:hypothetical protein
VDAPVTVRLSAPDLAVERAERTFAWDGEYQTLDFRVSVPADAPSRRTTLTFEVLVGAMDVGPLILDLEIGAVASAEPARAVAESPATAFVSYSHKDLNAVYHGVSVLQTFYRADFFVDRDSLVPSAPWEEQLGDAIVARDVFLLFWSSNAAASREVEKEWKYALEKKGLRAMRIHLLERVDVATIPEPFHSLHLDNKWLRLMDHPPVVPEA